MSGGIGLVSGEIRVKPEDEPLPVARRSGGFPFFTFRQLNALAVMVVLGASGMVALTDLAFLVFSIVYIVVMSCIAFPPSGHHPGLIFSERNVLLSVYIALGAVVGLVVPIIYIVEGVVDGDQEGMKAAAPHLFLLCAQILMEGWTYSNRFSLPARAFVPIFYNTKRVFTIADWVRAELGKGHGDVGSPLRLLIGRGLALANLAFWCFNLFCFLLPVYLPRAMRAHFAGDDQKKIG